MISHSTSSPSERVLKGCGLAGTSTFCDMFGSGWGPMTVWGVGLRELVGINRGGTSSRLLVAVEGCRSPGTDGVRDIECAWGGAPAHASALPPRQQTIHRRMPRGHHMRTGFMVLSPLMAVRLITEGRVSRIRNMLAMLCSPWGMGECKGREGKREALLGSMGQSRASVLISVPV